jgi:hypothetical protein
MEDHPNPFLGKPSAPAEADVAAVLGDAKAMWDAWLGELASLYGARTTEWKSYSPKAGWSLRVLKGKRTIVWLSPRTGLFMAAFVLGEKAVAAAKAATAFPAGILQLLEDAPRYPEGRGVRIYIQKAADLDTARRLTELKLAH